MRLVRFLHFRDMKERLTDDPDATADLFIWTR